MRRKIRHFTAACLILSIAVSSAACGQQRSVKSEQDTEQHMGNLAEDKTEQRAESGVFSARTSYPEMILTKEEMLSDYDAMWKAVKENYPFFGMLARSNPDHPDYYDEVIGDYRRQIADMQQEGDAAMWEFITIVSGSLYDVCGLTGHVSILNPHYFRELDINKKYIGEYPELQPWVDVSNRPEVIAFYDYYDYLLTLLNEAEERTVTEEKKEEEEKDKADKADKVEDGVPAFGLHMERLGEKGDTAYVKVDSFDDLRMEEEVPRIQAFLKESEDCGNLIIDIRDNGGGNAAYWEEAFVRPNIAEPLTYRLVRLMRDTALAGQFYGSSYQDSNLSAEEVKNDPRYSEFPEEDKRGLAMAREIVTTIEPEDGGSMFQGRIWLLTGPSVYSSAEAFAVFCRETGFATLVGQRTGGSNSGGAILYELPVSHLLIQFDVEYCLNGDGSCNMEMGTAPDIESDEPLQTVLDMIAAG